MKKALLILLVLSIVGAAAFADVKFGAFASIGMRADVNTVGSTSADSLYAYEWFQGTSLIGLATASFVGADPNMGFDTRFIAVHGAGLVPAVDYANAWMKLWDGMLTLNLGMFQASEDFETAEMAWGQNLWNYSTTAAFTAYVKPVEGLTIGYQLPLALMSPLAAPVTIADSLYNSKVGVRYDMKDMFGVTAGYLMHKASNSSDAYFGLSIKAIPSLGLWFEGYLTKLGDSSAGETSLYAEANYPVWNGMVVGLASEINIFANTANATSWVVEPYVIYPMMEKLNLMLGVDIANGPAWGWYGNQVGGSKNADDGIAWDVFVRASFMSPLGELRVQAKYGSPDVKTNPAVSYFQVFAGVKWGF
jgi:hypothetical protein